MYAEKLSPLIRKFPQDAEALRRLKDYLVDFEARRGDAVQKIRLDPPRMFEIMQAGSMSRLARLTAILIDAKVFKRQVLIRFPSGSGLTFMSYSELPLVIRDPVRDIEVEVTEDIIEASYILVIYDVS